MSIAAQYDVIIIGAGLSGIGAGVHLQTRCSGRSFAILEGRARLGGTWDLFRYPGVRSDSDMHTLGFGFRPWQEQTVIAGGGDILRYLEETAVEYGLDRHIRYGHRVRRAAWSSADTRWTLQIERDGKVIQLTCNFLFTCCGYYDYRSGYTPAFPDQSVFAGPVVHPQAWPEDLDVDGKRVVVIGSGATAVTLVPALTKQGAHVTMLQRSPTYVVSLPSRDALAEKLRRYLPARWTYKLARWRNILLGQILFTMARKRPEQSKQRILGAIQRYLGPDYDVATHFTPSYKPWDQRVCLVPDGDLFRAIKADQAEIVTDTVERFCESGLELTSGRVLAADIVVTATGLRMQMLGGMAVTVDGETVDFGQTLAYRGLMVGGVPNLAMTFGYTNASWTLKSDLTGRYVCRLLNYMARHGFSSVTPVRDPAMASQPLLDFTSGYVQRGRDQFPAQGTTGPWRVDQNYLRDLVRYRLGKLNDGTLRFR